MVQIRRLKCATKVEEDKVLPSYTICTLKESLRWRCEKCNTLTPITEKDLHVYSIVYNKTLLSIYPFNITDSSDIPQECEEAALHVIKIKIAKSNLPNISIEFKTGGSRVSFLWR